MPQVPYNPVPSILPESQGRSVSVETPGAAFGENIGAAVSKLGQTGEVVGNEVFDRALAIQQLANETDARNNVMAAGKKMALDHADFIANNPGTSARAALPGFLDGLEQTRQQFRQGLNPAAQRLYDAEVSSFVLRNVNSAALHAGEAFKSGANQSETAAQDVERRSIPDPNVQEAYDQLDNSTTARSYRLAGLNHWTEAQRKDWELKNIELNKVQQIDAISNTNPTKALELYAQNEQSISPEERNQLQRRLWHQNETITADNLAQSILKKNPGITETDALQKADELAPSFSYGDQDFISAVRGRVSHWIGQGRTAANMDRWTAQNTIADAIASEKFTDARAMLADPTLNTAALTAHLDAKTIQDRIDHRFQDIGDKNFIHIGQQYEHIHGLAYEDRQALLAIDPYDPQYHFNKYEINQVNAMRKQALKGDPLNWPQVNEIQKYMVQQHSAELLAIGVLKKSTAAGGGAYEKGKNWNAFVGNIATALDRYMDVNQHMPTSQKDLEDNFAKPLVATHAVTGWLGYKSQVPDILGPTPAELAKLTKIMQDQARNAKAPPPSVQDVARKAGQLHWQEFFENQKAIKGGGAGQQ